MCIQDSVFSGLRAHTPASVMHPFQQNLIQMNYFQGADPSCRPRRIIVSPRNEAKSRRLFEDFPDIIEIAGYMDRFFQYDISSYFTCLHIFGCSDYRSKTFAYPNYLNSSFLLSLQLKWGSSTIFGYYFPRTFTWSSKRNLTIHAIS